jgi:hypothetical protein
VKVSVLVVSVSVSERGAGNVPAKMYFLAIFFYAKNKRESYVLEKG